MLPNEFPSHLSTTLFTLDRQNWGVAVNGKELKAAQGKLVTPWTFDVQNVHTGCLTLLLPNDFKERGKIQLKVKEIDGLINLWCNEHDRLGWTYEAPQDGQLVIRYPFDTKWRLTVDDRPAEINKVDTYFIGFPLSKGVHKILLEYWPQTLLRFWIALSMLGTFLGFFGVVGYGLTILDEELQV